MAAFEIKELSPATWPDFEQLVERHCGIWGGCWCLSYHRGPGVRYGKAPENRAQKERLVRDGRTHAALVYQGRELLGWCQFGVPAELPARMTSYRRLKIDPPDWRITCFFVDRGHRRQGVSTAALEGALRIIAREGGGSVDCYPDATDGRSTSSSFLWGGTERMCAGAGFRPLARLGTVKRILRKQVRAARPLPARGRGSVPRRLARRAPKRRTAPAAPTV